MNTRQKIKNTEMRIISALGNRTKNPAAERAFLRTVDYFSMNDYLDRSNHSVLLKSIYYNRDYSSETLRHLAWRKNVSERTIYRYRKKYIKCFMKYYSFEQDAVKDEMYSGVSALVRSEK